MTNKPTPIQNSDWELSEDFYKPAEGAGELRLEDFMEPEEASAPERSASSQISEQVQQLAARIHQVKELSVQGKTAAQIGEALKMDPKLAADIMICVQSFPEDNDVAVAHLIMMG